MWFGDGKASPYSGGRRVTSFSIARYQQTQPQPVEMPRRRRVIHLWSEEQAHSSHPSNERETFTAYHDLVIVGDKKLAHLIQ